MKKKIMLATSVLALAAGSIFAVGETSKGGNLAKIATEQCPPECCNSGGECGPLSCGE